MCKIAYDKLDSFLYDYILDSGECYLDDVYAVSLSYSYDGKEWYKSIEVFELNICEGGICWFNDWWEGQPFIKLFGICNINEAFIEGDYNELIKEFTDENSNQDTV